MMCNVSLFAQSGRVLQLASANYELNTNWDWNEIVENTVSFHDNKWVLIQFQQLPSETEKASLKTAGIDLVYYLPQNTWAVKVSSAAFHQPNLPTNIYAVAPILPEYKMTKALMSKQYPAYAIKASGNIALNVECWEEVSQEAFQRSVQAIGAKNIQKQAYARQFSVEIAEGNIAALAALPFVSFVSPIEPLIQSELTYRNTVGRANYLSSGINGMNFNGEGVVFAIEEGGILDTLSIDFQGRKAERTTGNNVSDHKTGCFENAGSAGNYNPKFRANAWGATIYSLNTSTWSYYDTANLTMASHSYGWGIGGGYWAGARDHDQQIRVQPSMMHFYSSGNVGGDTCNYGTYNGIGGWCNITGGSKQAKNLMAINNTSPYDELSFGSVGPTYDGRIKPDVCIEGWEGTSYSSPKAAGMMAQLYQAWKSQHNGQNPPSALIKAFMLNTADDMYNPGPDFKTGFGRINARRAYNAMVANQYYTDSITTAITKNHLITVPANVKQLRVMLYWSDYEATTNAAIALVNDLDVTLTSPSNQSTLPWVLNTFPHADSLDNPATRGGDHLNNVEQITLSNPVQGTYTVNVNGFAIPQGGQRYYVVYEFLYDELTLTYPIGKEHFVAGEKEIIRWDNYGYNAGAIDVEFSTNNGATWTNIATALPNTATNFEWTVPNVVTGQAKVRVKRGNLQSVSALPFHIAPVVKNIHKIWSCGDSAMLAWDAVPNATSYRITRLGQKYMDSIGVATAPHFKVNNLNVQTGEWFSVQAYLPQQALSRRAIAWKWTAGDTNCVPVDAYLKKVLPYESGYYPDCYTSTKRPLKLRIQNTGTSTLTNANLFYRINGGPIFSSSFVGTLLSADEVLVNTQDSVAFTTAGTYTLTVWVKTVGDTNPLNDTLTQTIVVYNAAGYNPNYVQNFDNFTTCSTAWGCESVLCGLSGGWFNVPNTPSILGDSIDWRTLNGATGTGNTGPDFDHTTGNNTGKYLYLETSSTNGSGCQQKEAKLHSVCWDLRNTNQATLDYWYHAYGSTIGSLRVDVLGDNGWENGVIPAVEGDQGNSWKNQQVNLDNWQGQTVVVRFDGKSGNGYTGDLAIDDINLYTYPLATFQVMNASPCINTMVTVQNNSTYANNYQWAILPANAGAFANGTNSQSFEPQFTFTLPGTHQIQLIAQNTVGYDTLYTTVTVLSSPLNPSLSVTSAATCEGDTLSLQANAAGGPFAYQWALNGQALPANNQSTYTYPSTTTAQSGLYVCTMTNSCGTASANTSVLVAAVPVIDLGNDTMLLYNPVPQILILNAGAGFASYLWNNNANFTQPTFTVNPNQYTPGDSVNFFVTVTNANGCKATDTIVVWMNGLVNIGNAASQSVSIYPNPAKETCTIDIPTATLKPMQLHMFDANGKKVWTSDTNPDFPYSIPVQTFSQGVYLLEIQCATHSLWAKIHVER